MQEIIFTKCTKNINGQLTLTAQVNSQFRESSAQPSAIVLLETVWSQL